MISIHVFCSGNSNYVVYLCTFREFKCVLKCISRLLGRMVNKWTPLNSFYEYFGRKLLFGSFLDRHPQLLTEYFHFHHEYSGQWVSKYWCTPSPLRVALHQAHSSRHGRGSVVSSKHTKIHTYIQSLSLIQLLRFVKLLM